MFLAMYTKKVKAGSLLLGFIALIGLGGCNTVDDGSYTEPIRLYEKIGGKWVLNSMVQTDESNAKTMTLTNLLDFDTFVIHFDCDATGAPSAFTIDGDAPTLLPVKGTWTLDSPFYKSDGEAVNLTLKGSDASKQLTISSVPGATKTLAFKLIRKVNDKPFVSYSYNLTQAE